MKENNTKTWVAIGDSFTYIDEFLEETGGHLKKGYLTETAELLPFPVDVKHLAINGGSTLELLDVPLVPGDFYSILLGTNDWWGRRPIGTLENAKNHEKGTILGNLSLLIQKIRAIAPNAPIFLMNPIERSRFVYCFDQTNTALDSSAPWGGQRLSEVADAITDLAKWEGAVPVDIHKETGITPENAVNFLLYKGKKLSFPEIHALPLSFTFDPAFPYPKEAENFTFDGLHPSPKGCKAIAEVLAKAIKSTFAD